jgi:predicted regulator of Ras-like GTPase activity (Roadblock/LC7/MglB family)
MERREFSAGYWAVEGPVAELRESEEYQEYVKEVVRKVPGAIAASVAGIDGISLAGYSHVPNFDFGLVDAELASIQRTARSSSHGMTAGEAQEVVVISDKATFIIRPIGEEFYISITLRGEENLGIARLVAKKMAEMLSRTLE